MKYNININQKAIVDLGLDLDVIDATILDWMKDFALSNKILKIHHEGETYFFFAYEKILKDLPIINIKKDTIYRRIKKMAEQNIIIPHPNNQELNKPFYKFSELFNSLNFDIGFKSEPSDYNPKKVGIESEPSEIFPYPYGFKSEPPTDLNPNDYNINNNIYYNYNNNTCPNFFEKIFFEIWNEFSGKKKSAEIDFKFFLEKVQNKNIDFENLKNLAKEPTNIFFQTFIKNQLSKISKKVAPKKVLIEPPTWEDFWQYQSEYIRNKFNSDPAEYYISSESKYLSWIDNDWRDGHGNQIKDWKSKARNIVPFLKKITPNGNEQKFAGRQSADTAFSNFNALQSSSERFRNKMLGKSD